MPLYVDFIISQPSLPAGVEVPFTLADAPGSTVFVQPGDSIVRLAVRHLGEGVRWREIAALNSLEYPYVAEDPHPYRAAGVRVVGPGEPILIPLPGQQTLTHEVYGTDLAWSQLNNQILFQGGNPALDRGLPNLAKALYRRLITYPGELPAHPEYGCRLRDHLGQPASEWRISLMALDIKQALLQDGRVVSVRVEGELVEEGWARFRAAVEPIPPGEAIVINISVTP